MTDGGNGPGDAPPGGGGSGPTPDDLGLLVPLFRAVEAGTMSIEHACGLAAEAGGQGQVSAQNLGDLAEAAFRQAAKGWESAWLLIRIVSAAAEAAHAVDRSQEMGRSYVVVAADLIAVAAYGLQEVGDIRLFTAARAAGDRSIPIAEALGMREAEGVIRQRRGSMILDCYTSGRTPANFAAEFQFWVQKALQAGDPDLALLVSTPSDSSSSTVGPPTWPSPLDAMDLAEEDLQAAQVLVGPNRRGQVLKAVSQVLEWRAIFGGPPDRDQLIKVCTEALDALSPDDVQGRLAVAETLERAGRAQSGADLAGLLDRMEHDWSGYASSVPASQAWDAVTQAASLLASTDPERGLRLLQLQRALPSVWLVEARRDGHWLQELTLLAQAWAPKWAASAWSDPDGFARTASMAIAAAESGGVPAAGASAAPPPHGPAAADELPGALLTVALASTKHDQEGTGLRALHVLEGLGGPTWNEHLEAMVHLGASLRHGEAVNCERRGQLDDAVSLHLDAATEHMRVGGGDAMVTSLAYVVDLIAGGGITRMEVVAAWCAAYALAAEALNPAAAPEVLQRLVALTLAQRVAEGTSLEEIGLLLATAKGRRFAALLTRGTLGWVPDAAVTDALAEVLAAEQALPADRPLLTAPSWEESLDRDDLVTAYAGEYEQSPEDKPEEQIVIRQRAVERRITAQLAGLDTAPGLPPIPAHEWVDARTAVLMLYEGVSTDGRVATYSFLMTDTDVYSSAGVEPMPSGVIQLEAHGHHIRVPASGMYVAALRRGVQEEPAPDAVSGAGNALLAGAALRYTGPLLDHLEVLKEAGKDRLLVVPHGASHFLPVHLFGQPGQTLADDWTVTYLPNAALLCPTLRPASGRPRRDGAAVFALGYADQARLPGLASSAAEGRAIGTVLGVEPIADGAATERAFTEALESRRYVHLRAHGQHNVDAPLFQTVFLSPGEGGDGRFRAHEVLAHDLRGLELVTLGACETALGRIDLSDNPRGLPAALLLAGAEAVVGTLWEVNAEASTTFFTTLYSTLTVDEEDLIGAFGAAQRATRAAHPEYRDWGAFCLSGGYRVGKGQQ